MIATGAIGLGVGAATYERRQPPPPAAPVATSQRAPTLEEAGHDACAREIEGALAREGLPGAPGFEAARTHLLARAKGEPVLFVRPPRFDEEASKEAARYRSQLAKSPSPYFTLHQIYRHLRGRPEVARQVLMPEGYLYTESPDLAAGLVYYVKLPHLFSEKELWIHRGGEILHVVRKNRFRYEYADGPEAGRAARLMFLDRVATSRDALADPLHLDVRSLAHREGFDRVEVEHLAHDAVVARLRYGDAWARALLERRGERLDLVCREGEPAELAAADAERARALRMRRVLDQQQAAILLQVEEALPFDEPRTEFGQQDGELRRAWKWAYRHGWYSYEFNDDHYQVFDRQGRAKQPQVCIDFVTDTFERASGTWWAPKDAERQRTAGLLDFDNLDIVNRRSVEVFVNYAWGKPDWFDVYDLAFEERVRFLDRGRFFDHIAEHRERYRPGDVVVIHGPRNDGEAHYHSFFVFEADPVSGMPTLLAGNAGKPRIRTWEGVMRSAPLRSMKHRVRPRLEWLESVTKPPAARAAARPIAAGVDAHLKGGRGSRRVSAVAPPSSCLALPPA